MGCRPQTEPSNWWLLGELARIHSTIQLENARPIVVGRRQIVEPHLGPAIPFTDPQNGTCAPWPFLSKLLLVGAQNYFLWEVISLQTPFWSETKFEDVSLMNLLGVALRGSVCNEAPLLAIAHPPLFAGNEW